MRGPRLEISRFQRRQMKRVMEIENASFGASAYDRELFEELHQECGSLFLVAKRTGRIAGYSITCVGRQAAELISIAVAPEHRNAGVARALLERTVAALRKAGVPRLRLAVRTTSEPALRLYGRFGFARTGLLRRYYEDGADAYSMALRL